MPPCPRRMRYVLPPAQACVHSDAGRDGRVRRARGCADGVWTSGESAVISARLGRPRQYQSWSPEHGSQSVSPQRPHVDTRRWQKHFLQVAQTVTVLPCRQRKHMRTCGTETSAAVRVLPVASGVFTLLSGRRSGSSSCCWGEAPSALFASGASACSSCSGASISRRP